MTTAWDSNVETDPKTFATTFKSTDTIIYVAFKLVSGKGGEVTATWKYQGQVLDVPGTTKLDVEGSRWAAFSLKQSPAFKPGEYEVELAVTGTDEAKVLKFTVTGGSASAAGPSATPGARTPTPQSSAGAQSSPTGTPSKAKFDQAALIRDWNTSSDPDPRNFATTFKGSDKEIDAVFKLTAGTDARVTAIWKYKGQVLYQGGLLDVLNADYSIDAKGGRWAALYISAPTLPVGDYQVDLSIVGTTEARSLKFTVTDSSTPVPSARVKLDQAGLVTALTSGTDPDPRNFATVFKPSDVKIYVAYKLALDAGAGPQWITASWKYKGDLLGTTSAVVSDTGWKSLFLTEPSFPVGDYQVDLTLPGTGETKQIKFTVR
ncbi:MAG TPA: hypothetical protein VJB57_16490 [Dehalococcoidia bacterium]|nr:hypothetical protein [Dehalococcoidia bacterium]